MAPGGAALLDECVARGLLLGVPAPAGASRWHPQVGVHVRRLVARKQPVLARRAAHRAAARHLDARDPAAAVRHALDGAAPEPAGDVLTARWPDLLARGELDGVARSCAALPGSRVRVPGVATGTPTALDDLVGEVLAPGRLPPGTVLRRGEQVLADPGADDAARATALYLTARRALHRPGAADHAAARLAEAGHLADLRGWPALALACRGELAVAHLVRGQVREARETASTALDRAVDAGWQGTPVVAAAHLASGLAAYWRDELDVAHRELSLAVAVAGSREVAVRAAGALAVVCLALGDPAGLHGARVVTDAPGPDGCAPEDLGVSRAFLTALQIDAQRRPREALALVDPRDRAFTGVQGWCWQSDARLRCGDRPGAVRALRAATASVGPDSHVVDRVTLWSAEAVLRDGEAAHRALEQALDAAAPQGIVRPLRDRAGALRGLLVMHLRRGTAHENLVARLLAADHDAPPSRGSAWALTGREQQVLACMPSQMTAQEIADSMYVSVNTVKTHLRAIYRKLGVDGRRTAVRTAVRRGLL